MTENKSSSRNVSIMVGSVIILILSAISFVFLPAVADFNHTSLPPVGKFRGRAIEDKPGSLFNLSYSSVRNQERSSDEYSIMSRAFEQTVVFMNAFDALDHAKFTLPPSAVNREMRPYFSDENGVYSPSAYKNTARATKIDLRKAMEQNTKYMTFYKDFTGRQTGSYSDAPTTFFTGIKKSSAENPYIIDVGKKLRKIDYVAFPFSDYPSEEAVNFAKSSKENTDLFSKYDMSVITISDEAKAKATQRQVALEEITFEDAVKEFSEKIYSGDDGKLTDSYYYQLKKIIKNEADLLSLDAVEVGAISQVVQTSTGWSFFKKNSKSTEANFTNQATIDAVVSYMNENETGKIEEFMTKRANDFANKAIADGFDKTCESESVEKKTTESAFSLNYNNNAIVGNNAPSSGDLSGAATDDKFLVEIFKLRTGEISMPILLGKNIIVATLIEESERPEEDKDSGNWLTQYYPGEFDRMTMNDSVLKSDDIENDVLSVYLKYYSPKSE